MLTDRCVDPRLSRDSTNFETIQPDLRLTACLIMVIYAPVYECICVYVWFHVHCAEGCAILWLSLNFLDLFFPNIWISSSICDFTTRGIIFLLYLGLFGFGENVVYFTSFLNKIHVLFKSRQDAYSYRLPTAGVRSSHKFR